MSGSRRFGASVRMVGIIVGVVGLVAVAACTGGDGGDALIVDDGDAAVTLASAIEDSRGGSGRIVVQAESSSSGGPDGSGASSSTTSVESEYSGEDSLTTFEMSFDTPDVPEVPDDTVDTGSVDSDEMFPSEFSFTMLNVGGVSYMSADSTSTWMDEEPRDVPAELAAAEWIDVTEDMADDEFSMQGQMGADFDDPLRMFGDLRDVAEVDPQEIDGESYRRFEAALTVEDVEMIFGSGDSEVEPEAGGTDPEMSPEEAEGERRYQAIEDYRNQSMLIGGVFLVGQDGLLRRVTVDYSMVVGDEFAECLMLASGDGSGTVTIDITDLGSDIQIVAPDPATVISSARVDELTQSQNGDELSSDTDLTMLQTTRGEWTRDEIIEELLSSGSVIGVDPTAAVVMTDQELVAAFDQLQDALDALPRYPTMMGDLTRPEMLDMVVMGMEREGVDPALADGMTDQQLADLIDSYMESMGGPATDENFDEFAGCPG